RPGHLAPPDRHLRPERTPPALRLTRTSRSHLRRAGAGLRRPTTAETQVPGPGGGSSVVAGRGRRRGLLADARLGWPRPCKLSRLHGPATVDRALGQAATAGRFGRGNLASILTLQADDHTTPVRYFRRVGEALSRDGSSLIE